MRSHGKFRCWNSNVFYTKAAVYKRQAKQGVDFFIDKFWDKKNTGWAWVTDRKGNVLDNGKLVYGQTFAIYALAEYYMATGDERGIEYAEKTFDAVSYTHLFWYTTTTQMM